MKKVPQFNEVTFNLYKDFEIWLNKNTCKKILLDDRGQDIQMIWVHETGEILNCDFHASMYNGRFVGLNHLKCGLPIYLFNPETETFQPLNGLIVNEIIECDEQSH